MLKRTPLHKEFDPVRAALIHATSPPCWPLVTVALFNQELETGCPNEDFTDFWWSKVWYKVYNTNEINMSTYFAFLGQ